MYVAPLTVETLPDCAEMTRDLSVGTAELVIDVDFESTLVVVVATAVILPPETVMETVTDPYWWVTVGPAKVPSLKPLAGAAVVAFAAAADADESAAASVSVESEAAAEALGLSDVKDVGSVATAGAPTAV